MSNLSTHSQRHTLASGQVIDVFHAQGMRSEQQDRFGIYTLNADVLAEAPDLHAVMGEIFAGMEEAVQNVCPTLNDEGFAKDFGTTATLVMIPDPCTKVVGHIGDTAAITFPKDENGDYNADDALKLTVDDTMAVFKRTIGLPVTPNDHHLLTAALSHYGGMKGKPLIETHCLTPHIAHGATLCLLCDGAKNLHKPKPDTIMTLDEQVALINRFTPDIAGPVAEVFGLYALSRGSTDNITVLSTDLSDIKGPFMVAVYDGFGSGNGDKAAEAAADAVAQHPIIEARIA